MGEGVAAVILGAGGFIGQNLVSRLSAAGQQVRAIGRSPRPGYVDPAAAWHQADFADTESIAALVRDGDTVYHLIGEATPQSSNISPEEDIDRGLRDTVQFLQRTASRLKRFVFVSSGGTVYGVQSGHLHEESPTHPTCAYGINKLAVELYLGMYRHLQGLDYCVLRVANPFGPGQSGRRGQGVIGIFMQAALHRQPIHIWGDGKIVRDFIYIEDVTAALQHAGEAELGVNRVFNIGSGQGHNLLEIAAMVESISGRPLERRFEPPRALDLPHVVLDIERAERELGWRPQLDWERAMRETYAWYQSQLTAGVLLDG